MASDRFPKGHASIDRLFAKLIDEHGEEFVELALSFLLEPTPEPVKPEKVEEKLPAIPVTKGEGA